jgi:predicted nucleotidyltransferase
MNNILTEDLIEFAKSLVDEEQLAFVSVVGSHNYGTANEKSDVDIKLGYLPTFREFYLNKFNRSNVAGPGFSVDYTIHPLYEFVAHSLKGNMSFFEVFFSENCLMVGDRMESLRNIIRSAVEINYVKNYHSIKGMAHEKDKRVLSQFQDGQIDRAKKDAQHAIRLLATILNYKDTNKITLVLPEKYNELYLQIRNNELNMAEYDGLYYDLLFKVNDTEPYFRSMMNMHMQPLLDYVDIINREVYTMIRDSIIKRGF